MLELQWISRFLCPRPSAFIGRLACCHCISYNYVNIADVDQARTKGSIDVKRLAQEKEHNTWVNFGEPHEAFSRINESLL